MPQHEFIVRRKRIDEYGEWEYECGNCMLWMPKSKFRGCLRYIDAYGNCLMCSSCRAKKAHATREGIVEKAINEVLQDMGYDPTSKTPVWQQFNKRHGLK